MGRGWAILEGGNRGNVLIRSVVAVCYGDSSDWVAMQEDDRGCKLKRDVPMMRDWIAARRAVPSLMRANRIYFSE